MSFHWSHDEVRWELRDEDDLSWGSVTKATHGYAVGQELQPPQSYATLEEAKAYVERRRRSSSPTSILTKTRGRGCRKATWHRPNKRVPRD